MGNSLAKQPPEPGLALHKFRLLRVIGRGSFGKVRIVEHRASGTAYALKYINKATCIGRRAHTNTIRERDMLEELDHVFIANLRFSFQDAYSMYMVLDLKMGGDLRFHIMRRRFFEGVIRFWIAEVACALNYLHTVHHIVHRDVKPDNILMDADGHVALTDFNIATRIFDGHPHYAVAGTANYMAPEVVSGVGYTYSVDWWSLGVVMYECVYGRRPFRHKKNTDSLRRALMYDEIQFPIVADVQVTYDCVSAMRGFLDKDPERRLGCTGFDAVKAHPFFASIDWRQLEARRVAPPFTPSTDASNFDISHDLEEMLLEQDPLEANARRHTGSGAATPRRKLPPEHLTPEYEQITKEFAVFDSIEYDQFQRYLDVHGSISALAMEDARVSAALNPKLALDPSSSRVPLLSQIRLDDRPLINLDSQSTLTYSVTLSKGRTVLQQSIVSESVEAGPSAGTSGLRQRISEVSRRRGSSSGAPGRGMAEARSPLQSTQQPVASSGSASTATALTLSADSSGHLTSPGTLEPPSIVPIDILTWNQLLPSQRSLAHRYCIKMAHDRMRRINSRQRLQSKKDTGPLVFPQLSAALKISATKHRHAASTSTRDPPNPGCRQDNADDKAENSWSRGDSSAALLSADERRLSLRRRQMSADNMPSLGRYLPLNVNMNQPSSGLMSSLNSAYCVNPVDSKLDDSSCGTSVVEEEGRYYQNQPLPPPPPLVLSTPSLPAPVDIDDLVLSDAPQCPLPEPPLEGLVCSKPSSVL
ncbi:hypothetical protein GGF46_003427 [Coemansia sp. RSA 552]|nr:hypothetical protein GGF46_003427 [Coemansia sp. RSA 552]